MPSDEHKSKLRLLTGVAAIREALDQAMAMDNKVLVIGEGVPDPKHVFGTTEGLAEKYGSERVWEMPVSENGMTGICIGAALRGWRPVMTHQRADFSLLAIDQLVNNAAKWHSMFGSQTSVPMVIRLIIGRGWGQGAQHSQSLQAMFAHVPGLKVIMPTTPYDSKGLLLAAIADHNTVIFLEHRWLHGVSGDVPEVPYRIPVGKARVVKPGTDVSLVATSYMVLEAVRASEILNQFGISAEVVDLRTIAPLDRKTIIESVRKTGHLLALDTGWSSYGVAAEVLATAVERAQSSLKREPRRLALPDYPTPTAPALIRNYYPTYRQIVVSVLQMLGKDASEAALVQSSQETESTRHDVPDASFTGPY